MSRSDACPRVPAHHPAVLRAGPRAATAGWSNGSRARPARARHRAGPEGSGSHRQRPTFETLERERRQRLGARRRERTARGGPDGDDQVVVGERARRARARGDRRARSRSARRASRCSRPSTRAASVGSSGSASQTSRPAARTAKLARGEPMRPAAGRRRPTRARSACRSRTGRRRSGPGGVRHGGVTQGGARPIAERAARRRGHPPAPEADQRGGRALAGAERSGQRSGERRRVGRRAEDQHAGAGGCRGVRLGCRARLYDERRRAGEETAHGPAFAVSTASSERFSRANGPRGRTRTVTARPLTRTPRAQRADRPSAVHAACWGSRSLSSARAPACAASAACSCARSAARNVNRPSVRVTSSGSSAISSTSPARRPRDSGMGEVPVAELWRGPGW